ncbi:hypothetical protein [Mesorhizobium sp. WSM4887]|uniref:hypothetical protein n=1 Tax=Mesorhizobium sp. WSM4887 TaxID=3038543 RepID=UPI0024164A37|nr:hypothetical protein [Mesorhizobium sp. WSM4887]MDG4890917.1 hypothetical protein [Mesorhizobium sp. WSM4887]
MSDQFTTLEGLDASIEKARSGAVALATKVKELRAKIRDRLISSGTDKQARELRSQLAELSADQAFSEEHLAALHERRAAIAAEAEAARAKAERRAKADAFKALIAKRNVAAVAAEKAAAELGQAARDMSAATTEIRLSAATVGLKPNVVDQDEIRYGVEESLYQAGCSWLFADKPRFRFDAQGKLMTSIEGRMSRSGADILAMLPRED